jgi:RNA polymerase sigma factor (sigma-70 family)
MTPLPGLRPRSDRSFDRLYRNHAPEVYRYALAVLGNRADAEDATQTTFLNAFRAIERGERPEKARNWLIAIAHNVCRHRFRHARRRPWEVELDDLGAAWSLREPEETISADQIRDALEALGHNQRTALVMRELEGRSYEEIAAALNVSTGAVETLLFRARRALREQLEGALTCHEAEPAISRQLDGRLPRPEKAALRAHLRTCPECERAARRLRAQRSALRGFLGLPLPASFTPLAGGGAAGGAAGGSVAAGIAGGGGGGGIAAAIVGSGTVGKVAAVAVAGAVAGSGG